MRRRSPRVSNASRKRPNDLRATRAITAHGQLARSISEISVASRAATSSFERSGQSVTRDLSITLTRLVVPPPDAGLWRHIIGNDHVRALLLEFGSAVGDDILGSRGETHHDCWSLWMMPHGLQNIRVLGEQQRGQGPRPASS